MEEIVFRTPGQPMDYDWELRLAAFAALRQLKDRGGGIVTSEALDQGFQFQGERIAFRNPQMGIWRPQQLSRNSGAALTVVTVKPRRGQQARYDDQVASDEDYFVYRYQGDDPNLWTNKSVRRAYELQRPLIYLYGIAPGKYDPLFPCYVTADFPSELTFHLSPDLESLRPIVEPLTSQIEVQRRYAMRAAKVRLHQHRFRELVVDAYGSQCTICRLRHRELLDASHIIADRDERGLAEIPNGLAFCKIHHGAFDANILGIDPRLIVHIRTDVLEERDGPMLKHGLQDMHGLEIVVPQSPALRPRTEYLEERFEAFRAA
jgi:putative restriction endonuclease